MAHMVVCSYSSGSGSRLEDVFIQKTNGMGIFFRGETTNQFSAFLSFGPFIAFSGVPLMDPNLRSVSKKKQSVGLSEILGSHNSMLDHHTSK